MECVSINYGYDELEIPRALFLWGIPYWIDFLIDYGIIDDPGWKAYQLRVTQALQSLFSNAYESHLWELSFIHDWAPPGHLSSADWEKEGLEWRDTFPIHRPPFFLDQFDLIGPVEDTVEGAAMPGSS